MNRRSPETEGAILTKKGDIVRVNGLKELFVVTGFRRDANGQRIARLAGYHKNDSGFSFSLADRIRTSADEKESWLIHPLPGFKKILSSGPDVKPILDELRAKRRVTSAP